MPNKISSSFCHIHGESSLRNRSEQISQTYNVAFDPIAIEKRTDLGREILKGALFSPFAA